MEVETSLLPEEILDRLPIAFRISEKFDTELITDPVLRYEIEKYVTGNNLIGEYSDNKGYSGKSVVYEIVPELSYKRAGITTIDNEEEFVVLLIRNHLRIPKGSYVFDPSVGTKIYEYLKYLDIVSIRESLYSELNELVQNIVSEFNLKSNVSIDDVKLIRVNKNTENEYVSYKGAVYRVLINLRINNEPVELSDEFEL
jgi:hypothetical protein